MGPISFRCTKYSFSESPVFSAVDPSIDTCHIRFSGVHTVQEATGFILRYSKVFTHEKAAKTSPTNLMDYGGLLSSNVCRRSRQPT